MKKLMVVLFATAAVVAGGFCDDVAVMDLKIGREKKLQRVAIEFYEDAAPATVANFKKLARKNFYNGTSIHRVFPHLMVQAGDPLSFYHERIEIGTGGPEYTIPAEVNGHNQAEGTVSAARLPDKLNPARVSSGSQLFVTLAPVPEYDGQYTVFGHVFEGLEVLNAISELSADSNDNPLERVVIKSVQIVPRESLPKVKPKASAVGELLRHLL